MRLSRIGFLLAVAALVVSAPAMAGGGAEIDIPFEKFVLKNGLTVIVHEDHKAPIVAVNVWYHVGSKNEKPGKTGFAHLFEHLMFNGSENFNDDYFKPFDRVGATDMNGTTNVDRTNYFQNVPSSALDVALWMESDRMGHLLGALDQARLDEQRGVVQNEKRQGENQPYGKVFRTMVENAFPQGHPYSWSTIGSMADLDAASLEDVHEWFKTYYGPNNAVIVLAGDIDVKTARERVEHHFGDIPAGPPLEKQQEWIAKRSGAHRMVLQDRVPQARVYKTWNAPAWGSAQADDLQLASDVLVSGKNSRLYKRLVYDDQSATDVAGFLWTSEIASSFVLWATAQPGQDLQAVERAMDEEIARFLSEGPTEEELRRVKTTFRADFVRGSERIGGFGGKSDILAQNEVYGGDPSFYKTTLARTAAATPHGVHQTAKQWLADGQLVLEVRPFQEFGTEGGGADRAKLPEPGKPPAVAFPRIERATLANGMKVVLAARHAVPTVDLRLMFDAGFASDALGTPGQANLALDMLEEGTQNRTSLQISEQLDMLGATLGTGSDLDTSSIFMSALKENLDASLEIFADIVLNPAFPESDLARLKQQQIAAIQREKTTPMQMALRVFPKLLYGEGHAYSLPFTGSGDEVPVAALARKDLVKFHETWIKPNNATLVVVGDATLAELTPKLEQLFKNWKRGDSPRKNLATVDQQRSSIVYLIDRPDSLQSMIFAGHIAPPKADPRETAIECMNEVLGGSFNARINMNLREDKHWSYGARSLVVDARGQRPFMVFAPVQTDKTMESMQEIQKELTGIVTSAKPPTPDEVARAKDKSTLTLPGRWETNDAVAGDIAEMVRFGLAEDFWDRYPEMVRGLDLGDVVQAAKEVVQPERVVWVIVGDRKKVEPGIRELGLGELRFLDAEGNPLVQAKLLPAR